MLHQGLRKKSQLTQRVATSLATIARVVINYTSSEFLDASKTKIDSIIARVVMNHSTSEFLDLGKTKIDCIISRVVMNHSTPEFLDLSRTKINSTPAPSRVSNVCGPMAPSMPNMVHDSTSGVPRIR